MIHGRQRFVFAVLGAALGLAGTGAAPAGGAPPPALVALTGEGSGAGAMAPQLFAGRDSLRLSWLEPAGSGHAFKTALWRGGSWSAAVTIASGGDLLANWADVPSVTELADGTLYAQWLRKWESGGYGIEVARSSDGGRTWKRLGPLQSDRGASEHGFVSLVAADSGLEAVWLDGRKTSAGGPTQLLTAHIGAGAPGETVLDDRVCDCCATAAATTADGLVVVYRDRSAGDVRDIAALRWVRGTWTAPALVHADGWKIVGCPVNGPAVAALGRTVAVAWYTAAGDRPRVLFARSTDGGASFGAPVAIDETGPLGRVSVAQGVDGAAVVSWLGRGGAGAELRLRRIDAAGHAAPASVVAPLAAGRSSGVPRLVRLGDRLVLAWVEAKGGTGSGSGAGSRVRVASLPW